MDTNKLYRIAEREGIIVDRFSLPQNSSVSVKNGNRLYIGIDDEVSGAREKVCLAHELGHCVTFSFYNIYSDLDIREKHEKRAQNWAIKKLIPKTSYKKALTSGYDNLYSLAEYFGVTPDFMEKAVRFYQTA